MKEYFNARQLKLSARWLGFNAFYAILIWFAVIEKNEGATNLIYLFTGVGVFFAILMATPSIIAASAKNMVEPPPRSVPSIIDRAWDLVIVGFFVWHSWWVIGILHLLASTIISTGMDRIREQASKNIMDLLSQPAASE